MKKERIRLCGWCNQLIKSETKKHEKLVEHLERCHNDFRHKRR